MNEFFTWAFLASMAGCIAATGIITQFIKAYLPCPTQLCSYIIAVVLLYGAAFFTGTLTLEMAAIIPINAVLVSLGANGAYSGTQRLLKK